MPSPCPSPRAPVPAPATGLPPCQWGDSVRAGFFPLSLHLPKAEAIDVHMDAKVRGGCRLARVAAPAHTARMPAEACERLDGRYVKVLWQVAGQARFRQGHEALDLAAGQWLLYEASRPYELEMGQGARFVVLLVAAAEQAPWLQAVRPGRAQVRTIEDAARLALGVVETALDERVGLDRSSAATFVWSVRQLLDVAMQPGAGRPGPETTRAAATQARLLHQARQILLQHLDEAGFGPDALAARLGVSRRALYRAFEVAGDTPQAWLLRERLDHCRTLLLAPGAAQLNLTRLALEHGFNDAAYFSRAYKKRFGVPPSRARYA